MQSLVLSRTREPFLPPSLPVAALVTGGTRLIQEQETLGITPTFWKDEQLTADERPPFCRWRLGKNQPCMTPGFFMRHLMLESDVCTSRLSARIVARATKPAQG